MTQLEFTFDLRLDIYGTKSLTCQVEDHSWCKKHYIGWLGDDDKIIPCTCECHKPKEGE